jgi:peptide deformylase
VSKRPALQLVTEPAAVLHHRANPVRTFDSDLRHLVDELYVRCVEWNGVGLAAPQVGVNLQLAVIVYEDRQFVICNPEQLSGDGEVDADEGCLSMPGEAGLVRRRERVKVRYRNVQGKGMTRSFEGWLARIVQHESDHLRGVLCSDRLAPDAVFGPVEPSPEDEDEDQEGYEPQRAVASVGRGRRRPPPAE